MALFGSPCKIPIPCPKSQRNYAIQRPFSSKASISKATNFEFTKISISAPAEFTDAKFQIAKCPSSLSSPDESDEGAPYNVTIFVKGLAQSTSEGDLKTAFSRCGEVSRVKVVRNKKTKQSLGFAYLWFIKDEHAQAAVDEMNGEFFEGRFIHVELAKPEFCKIRWKHSPYKF